MTDCLYGITEMVHGVYDEIKEGNRYMVKQWLFGIIWELSVC